MNLIKDIRLFESDVPNIDSNPHPSNIGKLYAYDYIDCLDVVQRLLFLLRHRGFGFADFDHLYLNLTPCLPHGTVQDVNRYNIREFSWYQYADAGCDTALFNSWTPVEKTAFILEAIRQTALIKAPVEQRALLRDTFDEVLEKGAALLLPYRQKENEHCTVDISVRINDELDFLPVIRVTRKDGTVKAEHALRSYGRDEFISQIGTVTIGKSYVKITPRKNWHAEFHDLKPIRIGW